MIRPVGEWWEHSRVVINVRLWAFHLQVWFWWVRIIPAESGKNELRFCEFFWWIRGNREP